MLASAWEQLSDFMGKLINQKPAQGSSHCAELPGGLCKVQYHCHILGVGVVSQVREGSRPCWRSLPDSMIFCLLNKNFSAFAVCSLRHVLLYELFLTNRPLLEITNVNENLLGSKMHALP